VRPALAGAGPAGGGPARSQQAVRRQLAADGLARHLGQRAAGLAGEAAQQLERRFRGDAEPGGDGALGLLDDDPAVQRALELAGGPFGVAVLALIVVRIVARLVLGSPAYAAALGRLTHAAAGAAHLLLYALMVAMPVSGYLTSSAGGHEVSFFGLFSLPNLVGENKALDEGASQAHYVFAWAIGVVLAFHLLAVAWHAWIKRDTVLTRMWPRFRPSARAGWLFVASGAQRWQPSRRTRAPSRYGTPSAMIRLRSRAA